MALQNSYPDLFSFCTKPKGTVCETWSVNALEIQFRRYLNDWEVDRLPQLLQEVSSFKGTSPSPDTITWKHAADGKFSVNRLYKREVRKQPGGKTGPWKQIWKSWAPSKVKCFAWLVARRACLTQERLKRRGFQNSLQMFFCNEAEETNNHLFLHCKITSQICSLFLSLTETNWSGSEHPANLLSCWIRRGGSKSQKKWWKVIPACIWWTVWRERNGRCFKDKFNSIQKVKWNCIISLLFWCNIEEVEQRVDLLGSL